MRWMIILLLITGCTICESPYIENNGDCCLDADNDLICDDILSGRVTSEPEIPIEPVITVKEVPLISMNLENVKVQTTEYKKTEAPDFFFYISNQQKPSLKSARIEFSPQCDKHHMLQVSVNGKEASLLDIDCETPVAVDIPTSIIEVGENIVEFAGNTGPYLLRNASVTLELEETEVQSVEKTVLETDQRELTIASMGNLRLSNFYEMDFELDDYMHSDINLTFTVPEKSRAIILLNGKEILDDELEGDITLVLPNENLKADNTIKYIALE